MILCNANNETKLYNNIENVPFEKHINKFDKDNNVLRISEKNQKAFLPYKISDVKNIFENSKGSDDEFASMEDVVNKFYVLPLDDFKHSATARFREAFNLILNKEHGSIIKALDLGLELMFNFDLNPIIIAACRNLDELDIYLDCLLTNQLYDFKCFEIIFEVNPTNS